MHACPGPLDVVQPPRPSDTRRSGNGNGTVITPKAEMVSKCVWQATHPGTRFSSPGRRSRAAGRDGAKSPDRAKHAGHKQKDPPARMWVCAGGRHGVLDITLSPLYLVKTTPLTFGDVCESTDPSQNLPTPPPAGLGNSDLAWRKRRRVSRLKH